PEPELERLPEPEPVFIPPFPPADVLLPGFPPEEPVSVPEPLFEPEPAEPAPSASIPAAFARPPLPQLPSLPVPPAQPDADPLAGARHRRPAYDFDSGSHLIAPAPPPAVFPPAGSTAPPRRLPPGHVPRLPQDPYSLAAPPAPAGPRPPGQGPGRGPVPVPVPVYD